jgi:superfamily II DNA helicase RecQ
LAAAETQIVLLTATLPPSEEERLFRRMYWQREEVRLIRASTVRPNIKYSVVNGRRQAPERAAQLDEIVSQFLEDP